MLTADGLLAVMKKQGLKLTPQRRLVAAVLSAGQSYSAKQVLAKVRQTEPGVSPDTVYRTLGALCAGGMLCRVDKPGRGCEYEVTAGRHLHYIICSLCGRREVFEGCAFDQAALSARKLKGFALTGHRLELYGLCPSCQAGGKP
jgi:Fe2+ or Zn2+ uptake regulation protein